ncbi:GNAT family N-acetyltransferase [Virgibacillus sp. 6R]|uniref:GNAT family N-acetyltransferase n=1 Tax=Metabacillus sp. 22489 TaxID=3453928 RepID=UPI0011A6FF20
MIHFELNTIDKKHIEIDMMNSNPTYNLIAKGKEAIDEQDVEEEFRESVDLEVVRLFMKNKDDYIGIIDYCLSNPSDGKTWISLFVIHKKYQGSGLAEKIYSQFETRILEKGKKIISLAVHEINVQGIQLWSSLGFRKI